MKFLCLFSLFIICSCSSLKKTRVINEEQFDGLKFESLRRYDKARLQSKLQSQDPLSLCHNGEFKKAYKIAKSKLDKSLKNYSYWNQISTCYILEKKYTKARRFLDLALGTAKSKTQKASVLNNLGVIQLELKNFEEAKEYFKAAIKLSKKILTPRYNLAQIYLKFALYNPAKKQLEFLLNKNAQDIDFINSFAHLQLMSENYQKAITNFNKIPTAYRSRDDIATNLAMSYLMLGKLDFAKKTLKNADKKDSFYTKAQSDILERIETQEKAKKL